MASSHHRHQHHSTHQQINQCNSSCCSNQCCSNGNSCSPLLPPPNASDQLLQALATSLLLQSQQSPIPIPPQSIHAIPTPIPHPNPFYYSHEHFASNQHQRPFPPKPHNPIPSHKSAIDPLVSLLDRVAALESSLFSNPDPFYPQRSNLSPKPNKYSSNRAITLKDLAARTIQVHFRKFLVRRSQILRDLKRLAVMKCHVANLRATVSHRAEIDPKMVSDRAADLLLQLESIKSVDGMIYEGKRSIERELVRIVDFVDKIFLKEHQISLNKKNSNQEEESSEYSEDSDSLPEERKTKKKVSFEERSKKSRVFDREENGDESNFEEIEGGFGKKCGIKIGGLAPPFPAQMEMRREK